MFIKCLLNLFHLKFVPFKFVDLKLQINVGSKLRGLILENKRERELSYRQFVFGMLSPISYANRI